MISEAQRTERKNYLGASDAAAVLGLSRWKTPLSVWAEKTGAVEPENIDDKLPVIMGNMLEDVCAQLFEIKTGKKVRRANETIFHKVHPFLAANLDRVVVGEDAVLEIKTAGSWAAKEWDGEEVPQETIIQVLHQLAVTGKSKGYACCLVGGNQAFHIKEVERDEKLIEQIIAKEVAFFKGYIEPGVMPQTVTKNDADTLFKLFPRGDEGEAMALGADTNALLDNLEGLKADMKALEGFIDKEENALRLLLGDRALAVSDRWKVTWRNQTTNRLDSKALKAELPEVAAKYTKPTESRVLRIAAIKGAK